jgi:hypothetical protein
MALIRENLTDHQSETVGRTGDEDARHIVLLMLRLILHIGLRPPDGSPGVAPRSSASRPNAVRWLRVSL